MLSALPVDPKGLAFGDMDCGKGMCMRCAFEYGYGKVAGGMKAGSIIKVEAR